jgi:hypothetical protein
MEGQRERTSSRRRQRRKSKSARSKVVVEPVLIAARRPDSPRLETGFRSVVASAQPKGSQPKGIHVAPSAPAASDGDAQLRNGSSSGQRALDALDASAQSDGPASDVFPSDGASPNTPAPHAGNDGTPTAPGVRRRAVRIVKLTDNAMTPGNREQQLLDRLVRSQGRGAISRAADDLWEGKFVAPKRQEVQIQLLEHENEIRARDAVFIMAELLQREAPIKRPVLDQRLRRLETSAEDPITRDAAGALRRSMRVHHGLL